MLGLCADDKRWKDSRNISQTARKGTGLQWESNEPVREGRRQTGKGTALAYN